MGDAQALIRSLASAHASASVEDVGSFYKLAGPLNDLTRILREDYQSSVAVPIRRVIDKLEDGRELTTEDVDLVGSFVAGDVEAHTRLEDAFRGWVQELGRLVSALAARVEKLEGRALLEALGEVNDAQRVVSAICTYLEDKGRVARFRRTMEGGIDLHRGKILAEILKRQLASADE